MSRLKSFLTIKDSGVFGYAYKKARCLKQQHVLLFFLEFKGREIGFTVSKKVGNAVVRNKAKRRIKSVFAGISDTLVDGRYIFVARASIATAEFDEIKHNIERLLIQYSNPKAEKCLIT